MLSLSANFATALKKSDSLNYRYIVAIYNTDSAWYYYGDQYQTITDIDDGTSEVAGVLLSKDIPIVQSMDFREHKMTIGGFSIQLIDDGLNDDWATNKIYNQAVRLYLGCDDLTDIDDYLLIYTGIAKDFYTYNKIITLNIENSSLVSQKDIPDLLSDSDAAAGEGGILPDDSQGMAKPLVYGDHRYLYMNDTENDMVYDRASNLKI